MMRVKSMVSKSSTINVAPVVHGHWIRPHWKNSNYCCDCSECGGEAMHKDYRWDKNGVYPICPNCGAPMRSVTTGWICTELGCGCKLDVYGNQYTDTTYNVDYWYEVDESDQGQKDIVLE